MKPSDRLKEIEKYYEEKINPNHPKKNVTWLINRIHKLTEALEHIESADCYKHSISVHTHYEDIARKALKEE